MPAPTPQEIKALTEPELEQLRLDAVAERVRRDELATLPVDIEALTQRFVDHGGDVMKLRGRSSYTKTPDPTP